MASVRLKAGIVEIECEGSEDFVSKEFPILWTAACEQLKSGDISSQKPKDETTLGLDPASIGRQEMNANSVGTEFVSISRIFHNMPDKKGAALAKATAMHLFFVKKLTKVTMIELKEAAKAVTDCWEPSNHGKNFNAHVKKLAKDKLLNEVSTGTYSPHQNLIAEVSKFVHND